MFLPYPSYTIVRENSNCLAFLATGRSKNINKCKYFEELFKWKYKHKKNKSAWATWIKNKQQNIQCY